MMLGIGDIITLFGTLVMLGAIYGTLKSNNKTQAEMLNKIECTMKENYDDTRKQIRELQIEMNSQIKDLQVEMNFKFEKYNGLRERIAISERDLKTLFNKFDELNK